MDEKPKSIWKKSFTGRMALVLWLAVAVFTVMLGSFIIALTNYNRLVSDTLLAVALFAGAFLVVCLILIYVVWPLLRWLFWTHWRRGLFSLACFVTLLALFYAEEDWRGWHAWSQFRRVEEAKGEKFYPVEVSPAAVPDNQNFALTPIVFTSYGQMLTREGKEIPSEKRDPNFVKRLEMSVTFNDAPTNDPANWQKAVACNLAAWQSYYRELAATTNLFPVPPQPQSPAADVLLAMGKYEPVIEELRLASQLPEARFPLEYDKSNPAEILLPHLAMLKQCVQVLRLRSLAELQAGQSEKALADVKLSLYLMNSTRAEPILISHLVRIAILQLVLQPVWEGLATHRWSEAQLAPLDTELARLDFLSDYGVAMRGERAMDVGIIEFIRREPNKFREFAKMITSLSASDASGDSEIGYFSGDSGIDLANLVVTFGPSGWLYQSELHFSQFYAKWYLPLADEKGRTISPTAVRAAESALNSELGHRSPQRVLESYLLPALGGMIKKCGYAQSATDLARVATALERQRLAAGQFPDALAALVPQFLAKVPHDVIGGQPLHYRRTSDGRFVLYAIGWNETDDGGAVVLKMKSPSDESASGVDISQGDWVWRYPVK